MNLKDLTEEKSIIEASIKKIQNYLENNNIPLTNHGLYSIPNTNITNTDNNKTESKISKHEITDLQQQLSVMKQYLEILQRRINRL